jgi:hypothetical protein
MGLTWADGEYSAWAGCYPESDPEEWITRETFGDTPAAALHALAAKLRERSDG